MGRGAAHPEEFISRGTCRVSAEQDCEALAERLLYRGATAVISSAIRRGKVTDPWLARMLSEKPRKVAVVALANRMARIIWAVTTQKEIYRARAAAA